MKKILSLTLFVIALLGVNAAAASADGVSAKLGTVPSGLIVPLGHGVDH